MVRMQISQSRDGAGDRGFWNRRHFLAAFGGAAVVPVVAGRARADSLEDWEVEADERIQEHRTADLAVEVIDPDGTAIEGATVAITMQEHDFGFGTAVAAETLINGTDNVDEYRETITELFNMAVLENHHKWRFFEDEQSLADDATAWLVDNGLRLRGHTCLWANVDAWAVPPDVVEAMGIEWVDGGATDPELDPDHVRERTFAHLEGIIEHYADFRDHGSVIEQWDIKNEAIHETAMIEAIEETDLSPTEAVTADMLAEWYENADAISPDDVATDVNDFNTLEGPYESVRSDYESQIAFLLDADVGLDGVGLQCHFSQNEMLTAEEVWAGLERYADYDVPIRITEFDMADPNWPESDKAEFFHWFLKMMFSHPAVTDFLMWGFRDDLHWRDDAPLFDANGEPKPSYDVYTDLVFDEWWTETEEETDANGTVDIAGFLGEYEVSISYADETLTETVTLPADGASVSLTIDPPDDAPVDTTDDDEDDFIPGFGAIAGIAGLVTAAKLVRSMDSSDPPQADDQ